MEKAPPNTAVEKIIVAVHGIGDQTRYATIQQVVAQFARQFGVYPAVPLGQFYCRVDELQCAAPSGVSFVQARAQPVYAPEFGSSVLEGCRITVDEKKTDAGAELSKLVFTEVYWADVPRAVAKEGFQLEAAEPWANTIVGRVQMHAQTTGAALSLQPSDFGLMKVILKEMLQTLGVLEKLTLLAEKLGLFKFDLKQVLTDYLGDVQLVTEFGQQRSAVVRRFAERLEDLHALYPQAEIHLISHSEGTVVSLLGLLQALDQPEAPGWLKQVRGWMTIGSPIDKHLALWPELLDWEKFPGQRCSLEHQIEWRNYYDYGDPVGFKLDAAYQRFIVSGKWPVFSFRQNQADQEANDDLGFGRYWFPGKAHNDYWVDSGVFSHFITRVVYSNQLPPAPVPQSKWYVQLFSRVVPYVAAWALLYAGVFVLLKTFNHFLDPAEQNGDLTWTRDGWLVFRYAGGVTCLLAGVTVISRVWRLVKPWGMRALALLTGGVFLAFFRLLTCNTCWPSKEMLLQGLPQKPLWQCWVAQGVTCLCEQERDGFGHFGMLSVALAVLALGIVSGWLLPKWGMRTLLVPGAAGLVWVLYSSLEKYRDAAHGEFLPVLLAALFFFYVWWLVALIFDLVLVWHRYIRSAVAQDQMNAGLKS